MNKMYEELCRVLDFPLDYYDKALYEANNGKLNSTWMEVNGELMYVDCFSDSGMAIVQTEKGGKSVEVETLELWNPDTGIYSDGKKVLALKKKTGKQWKKSFNINNYFALELNQTINYSDFYSKIYKQKPKQFANIDGHIYFNTTKVGQIKNGELVAKEIYKPELLKFLEKEGTECLNLP